MAIDHSLAIQPLSTQARQSQVVGLAGPAGSLWVAAVFVGPVSVGQRGDQHPRAQAGAGAGALGSTDPSLKLQSLATRASVSEDLP